MSHDGQMTRILRTDINGINYSCTTSEIIADIWNNSDDIGAKLGKPEIELSILQPHY